ncbi:MAG: 4-(cytidine 5'-diphospho)-2-C-methyl-D-erythritol kinase [Clostridia bacterium]|nr:4-(cytidine 5'-diphospho)-2-C-methyl-D-erythritol kinase [Clostridia bacterium]
MKLNAAAKVNLALDILCADDNGYHMIFSIMQSVSLFDKLRINTRKDKKINFTCNEPKFSKYDDNTIKSAVDNFFEYTKLENPGLDIYLEKNIPSQAGLAGGSADAAATLKALNEIFETNLDEKILQKIGKKVGSDVPFCIRGGTSLVQNTGDILSELPDFENFFFVILKPDASVSTKEAYMEFDRQKDSIYHFDNAKVLSAYARKDHKTAVNLIQNVFEQLTEVPNRPHIKLKMMNMGALNACMSGSGTAIFGVFDDRQKAKNCYEELKKQYKKVYLAEPCKEGVLEV